MKKLKVKKETLKSMTAKYEIAVAFSDLLFALEDILPGNNREFAIAKTKLEEASFFAKKALRNYKENVA